MISRNPLHRGIIIVITWIFIHWNKRNHSRNPLHRGIIIVIPRQITRGAKNT